MSGNATGPTTARECQTDPVSDSRVRYARNGDVRLAYRVFGDSGPVVIWVPGWVVSNVDTMDAPESQYARGIELGSEAARFVVWDRRGSGLSDPASHLLSLDERMDDLCAVVDATAQLGDDRPTLYGSSEGGAITILFAATFPIGFARSSCWRRLHGTPRIFPDSLGDSRRPRSRHSWTTSTTTGERARFSSYFKGRRPMFRARGRCSASCSGR